MEFAIIIAILLAACIAWVVLGARADRRAGMGAGPDRRLAKGARAPGTTEAASTAGFGGTVFGGDAGAGGGDCG